MRGDPRWVPDVGRLAFAGQLEGCSRWNGAGSSMAVVPEESGRMGNLGGHGVAAVDGEDAILRDSPDGFTFRQSGNSCGMQ